MKTPAMEIAPSNDKQPTSQLEKLRDVQLWAIDQLTVLAEALGETVTKERLNIYAQDLCDLDCSQLAIAFVKARRQCRFFPKLGELRTFAGANVEVAENIEAEEAWQFVLRYLRKWGVERHPLYSQRQLIQAPTLDPRIDYAVRRVGGLQRINEAAPKELGFIQDAFIRGYREAPLAAHNTLRLDDLFGRKRLAGTPKQLSAGATSNSQLQSASRTTSPRPCRIKRIPEPMTRAECQDRRTLLRQQADTVLRSRNPTH